MNCPNENANPELLIAYTAGTLDRETTSAVEAHLERCPECRGLAEAQAAVWRALDAWETPPVSPDFDRRLYARIQQEAPASRWDRWWRAWIPVLPPRALPLALVTCAVLAISLILEFPWGARRVPPASQTVRVEQVETMLDDLDLLRQSVGPNEAEGARPDAM
jgi:anti-sigma factor RsiW